MNTHRLRLAALGVAAFYFGCSGSDGAAPPAAQGPENTTAATRGAAASNDGMMASSGAGNATTSGTAMTGIAGPATTTSDPMATAGGMAPMVAAPGAGSAVDDQSTMAAPGDSAEVESANDENAGASDAMAAASAGSTATTGDEPPATTGEEPPATGSCDRDCLLGFMQTYLDALQASDPEQVAISPDVKFTENGVVTALGEGTWQEFSEPMPGTRIDFADPVLANVGTQLVYNRGTSPVRLSLRLKVEEQQVTEIESITVGPGEGFIGSNDNLEPEPTFFETPANPNSREELLEITELYVDYLEGSKQGSDLPFAEDCWRYENGVPLAQGRASFETQSWAFMVKPRRILIVDEVTGITWANLPFYNAFMPPGGDVLVVSEAFKIMDGEFKMIQAVMRVQPNGPWE